MATMRQPQGNPILRPDSRRAALGSSCPHRVWGGRGGVYGVSGTKEEDTTEVHVATGLLTMVQAPAAPVATSGGGGDD